MRHYKKNTPIEVEWYDIVEDPSWLSEKDAAKEPDDLCKSLGYYLQVQRNVLYMSGTISNTKRNKLTIPLGCIKKVRKGKF